MLLFNLYLPFTLLLHIVLFNRENNRGQGEVE